MLGEFTYTLIFRIYVTLYVILYDICNFLIESFMSLYLMTDFLMSQPDRIYRFGTKLYLIEYFEYFPEFKLNNV